MTEPRKRRQSRGPYRVYLCGVTPDSAATARLHDPMPTCPNAADHAPMPADYGPWDEIANRRSNAKQRPRRCPDCGLWALAVGGREVPGWPRTMAEVALA